MNETEKKLAEMLKENTGIHMLDSGGAYGRHWQRNQERDFENEPAVFLTFDEHGIEATHNLYHWLAERLEYNEEMTDKFNKFSSKPENEDNSWFENVQDFVEMIGAKDVDTINTYNGESALSQVIQYTRFSLHNSIYVLLQVHGGCDVRGNYSKPVVFEECEYGDLFDDAQITISCERSDVDPDQLEFEGFKRANDPHFWNSYDAGYSWEPDDQYHNLEDYEISMNEEDRGKGKLYVDGDGNGYCPLCGSLLGAS